MKISSEILLAAVVLAGCCTEAPAPTFDIKQHTGIWVLYEIVRSDGTRDAGPFHGLSVFGAYDPSVQLNDDGTYVPLNWMGPDDVFPDEQEGGSYEYFPDESKLVLSGSSQIEFEVTHFSADDLWLMPLGNFNGAGGVQAVYKLRKEQIH